MIVFIVRWNRTEPMYALLLIFQRSVIFIILDKGLFQDIGIHNISHSVSIQNLLNI